MAEDCLQIVVMGVASSGKTVVGRRLAEALGLPLAEGDEFHSPANVAKMSAGMPLTDADRRPWLEALAGLIAGSCAEGTSSLVTCSALRRAYRDLLRSRAPAGAVFFVHLDAPAEILRERMALRTGHFMPPSLLRSQLDTLEPLRPDEDGAVVDASPPLEMVVEQALAMIRAYTASPAAARLCRGAETRGE